MSKRSIRVYDAFYDDSLPDDDLAHYEQLASRHRPAELEDHHEGYAGRRRAPKDYRRRSDDATDRS